MDRSRNLPSPLAPIPPLSGLDRRGFLRLALYPLLAGAAASLLGCETGAGPETLPAEATPPAEAKQGMVFDNHQHDAFLTRDEIAAGAALVLHIQGLAYHDHTVELTDADIAEIRAGREVTKPSTTDWGHSHEVVFNRRKFA